MNGCVASSQPSNLDAKSPTFHSIQLGVTCHPKGSARFRSIFLETTRWVSVARRPSTATHAITAQLQWFWGPCRPLEVAAGAETGLLLRLFDRLKFASGWPHPSQKSVGEPQ